MKNLRTLFGLLLISTLVCFSAPALARIGGGQHYSGSRSSSSSSSSHSYSSGSRSSGYSGSSSYGGGGGGGGNLGAGGCCMLVIFALIVVAIFWAQQRKQRAPGGGTTEAPPPSTEAEFDAWVASLKERDPNFDVKALYQKAADIFLRSQQVWSNRELQPVRAFMSDATFQRFETQLALMHAQNVRNVTAEQKVEGVELIGLEQNPDFDTVHLAIEARMRDVDVPWNTPEAEAQSRAQSASSSRFTEIWSFVRKPGTKTDPGKDLLRGKCPNCGAPFKGGAANTCEFCGAVVNSGNYDWTLAEITQSEELEASSEPPSGLEDVKREDPAFSLQILEDRTSLLFWKWIEARTFGEAGRIAKVSTPEYLHQLGNEVTGNPQRFNQCAVGAVITRNLSVGEGGTRAMVEVRWSADDHGGDPTMKLSTFVLARGPGAKTNASNGMATARCPNCNAPLTSTLSSHCDFCGTTLGGNPGEWLLSAVRTEEG